MNKHLFLDQIYALVKDEPNVIANLANISAFLNESLQEINWVGFYFIENNELVLGPFQGKVACVRIPIGKGVCGTAVLRKRLSALKMFISSLVILLVIVQVVVRLFYLSQSMMKLLVC